MDHTEDDSSCNDKYCCIHSLLYTFTRALNKFKGNEDTRI